jgi:galactose-1-phosphate uridylyltransferase
MKLPATTTKKPIIYTKINNTRKKCDCFRFFTNIYFYMQYRFQIYIDKLKVIQRFGCLSKKMQTELSEVIGELEELFSEMFPNRQNLSMFRQDDLDTNTFRVSDWRPSASKTK